MQERLLKFISQENLTATRIADEIGVQRSSISHILSGRNKPSFDFIQKLLTRYPILNSEWLLLGKGKMYKDAVGSLKTSNYQQSDLFSQNIPTELEQQPKPEARQVIDNDEAEEQSPQNISPNNYNSSDIHQSESQRDVTRVILFYSDGTFSDFKPNGE